MRFSSAGVVLALVLVASEAVAAPGGRDGGRGRGNGDGFSITVRDRGNITTNNALILLPANVQTGSKKPGNETSDQAPSATDTANFINFCSGKTLTNGEQVQAGSCNGVVMGDVPSTTDMVSSIITFPGAGEDIDADTKFSVKVKVLNLVAGSFTNPKSTYHAAPQQLQDEKVLGHTHITIQSLGDSLNPSTPPDPAAIAFFKGINNPDDGRGGLEVVVEDGLPRGFYRVCTMTSVVNHQPVVMPVAQRGAQDDCQKFTVGMDEGKRD
ncbi:hypothetical protein RUND412_008402 [Rhizina undulata]